MRINEIVEIIHGTLLNNPPLSSFENITANLARVQRGSLFIATTPESAKEAIALGAYGIVFEDGDMPMIDNEVAWIRVDLLQEAMTRFIRHRLLIQQIGVIFFDDIEFSIAQEIIIDERVALVSGGYADLLEATQNPLIGKIITCNPQLLEISLEYTQGSYVEHKPFKLLSYTLFDSKIYFDSQRYTLPLPSLFLEQLASVIVLCQSEEIALTLAHFQSIPYFKPHFIDARGNLCRFGQSGRVLIAERDLESFKKYSAYILHNAKWAKVLLFVPTQFLEIFSSIAQCVGYESEEELLCSLKENYHFGMILGVGEDFITQHFTEAQEGAGLFDD
ncbi:hypothetical protein [Helicobacter brantae]|uniref:Ferrochelatase n=1 Tax=Helicobacter brantae TaxID=375927 RepID=A0A3D8J3Q8_9HELI|nr:hypothetical protein [Helicobacter brantae]RDU71484.1 hypothetical protein CQA58_02765 [Helicobacter brantae]